MRLFLSHAWQADELGRDTHARARDFACALRAHGWNVWFDEDNLGLGHIDAAIAQGIETCPVFLVLLTCAYCRKVQAALLDPTQRDSCAKEWSCAMMRQRFLVPVVFEPEMRSPENWPASAVALHLAGYMYVDASNDDLTAAAATLDRLLRKTATLQHNDSVLTPRRSASASRVCIWRGSRPRDARRDSRPSAVRRASKTLCRWGARRLPKRSKR